MFRLSLASVVSLALAVSTPALGADAGTPSGPPGLRGDLLMSLAWVEGQTVSLEQAMPPALGAVSPHRRINLLFHG